MFLLTEKQPVRGMAVATTTYLVVHPVLHASGFGNQMGMLLQHLAIASESGRVLVVPPFHQPASHRKATIGLELLEADAVLNLTSLLPIAKVLPLRQLAAKMPRGGPANLEPHNGSGNHLVFSSVTSASTPRPMHLAPPPLEPSLAAVRLLRRKRRCAEDSAHPTIIDCDFMGYCHLPACRTRTRRACRRLRGGSCSRVAQRLSNNYLFAHRLAELLCNRASSRAGDAHSVDNAALSRLDNLQRATLVRLTLAGPVRAQAATLARTLGRYAAVHVRLPDASDSSTKGVNA